MFCQYVRLNEHALPPRFSSIGAAGADLSSAEKSIVPARGQNIKFPLNYIFAGKRLISTGLKLAIPTNFYGRIAPSIWTCIEPFYRCWCRCNRCRLSWRIESIIVQFWR
jgi:dUTPase